VKTFDIYVFKLKVSIVFDNLFCVEHKELDDDFQALLDKNPTEFQREHAEQLGVTRQVVLLCLHAIEKWKQNKNTFFPSNEARKVILLHDKALLHTKENNLHCGLQNSTNY
jgi:hypothetical protein